MDGADGVLQEKSSPDAPALPGGRGEIVRRREIHRRRRLMADAARLRHRTGPARLRRSQINRGGPQTPQDRPEAHPAGLSRPLDCRIQRSKVRNTKWAIPLNRTGIFHAEFHSELADPYIALICKYQELTRRLAHEIHRRGRLMADAARLRHRTGP